MDRTAAPSVLSLRPSRRAPRPAPDPPARALPFLVPLLLALAVPAPCDPVPAAGPPPSSAAVLPEGARASERLFGLPGLSNVGRVAPGILRGAQPAREGYGTLRRMGVRTVINLRSRHGEKEAVGAAGMRYVAVPMKTYKDVDVATVREVVRMMADPANRPVFVHCAQGRDRTGVVVAAYRMDVDGWPREAAEAEMQAFGFNDVWRELKEFVRRYPAQGGNDR